MSTLRFTPSDVLMIVVFAATAALYAVTQNETTQVAFVTALGAAIRHATGPRLIDDPTAPPERKPRNVARPVPEVKDPEERLRRSDTELR
jgi:hypothetical protein